MVINFYFFTQQIINIFSLKKLFLNLIYFFSEKIKLLKLGITSDLTRLHQYATFLSR